MRIVAAPYEWRSENAITGYHLPAGCVGSMDLRPLPDQSVPPRPGAVNLGLFALGEGVRTPADARVLQDRLSPADCRWLRGALRLKRLPEYDTLADCIDWLRGEGADPAGESAMLPAMPDDRGILEWSLGFFRRRKRWTPKLRASVELFRRTHRDLMERGPWPLHRKYLGASVLSTGVKDYRTLLCRRMWSESPLQPTTVISETFPGTAAALGGDQTWTEIGGTSNWENLSGVGRRANTTDSTSSDRLARCETDLSSANMIVRCTVPTHATATLANQSGVCARYASGASTAYFSLNQRATGAGDLIGIYKIVTGTITAINTVSVGITATYYPALVVNGSVQIYLGTNIAAGSDTAVTGNTRAGLYSLVQSVGDVTFDDWEARDMVESGLPGRTAIIQNIGTY